MVPITLSDEPLLGIQDLYETHRVSEARKYLALGWRLLKVLAKREEGEFACYVLGWPQDLPSIYPTTDYFVGNGAVAAHR